MQSATAKSKKISDGRRFREILGIVSKHGLSGKMTPEKLRAIIEELGPTYVKLGQIMSMRSDLLPAEYCKELENLRTDVAPMPIEEVRSILESEYKRPWDEVFSDIEPVPLGSASIAQAHEAVLADGQRCVIKVQRPDIYETMERDIRLLKKASRLMKYSFIGNAVDFNAVLEEMWTAAREEMSFTAEAENMRHFRESSRALAYIGCPEVYSQWCTEHVLVMEYIGGCPINDTAALIEGGYDLTEIGTKYCKNYIKQVLEDHMFHADPHPGNVRIQDGKIVWIDWGMVGRVTEREAELYYQAIRSLYKNDTAAMTEVVLLLGVYTGSVDRISLQGDIEDFFIKYRSMPMYEMNVPELMTEFIGIANRHSISVPRCMTMLCRGLVVLQGVLETVSPDINIIEIVASHMLTQHGVDEIVEDKTRQVLHQLADSGDKLTALPSQLSDTLKRINAGQTVINLRKTPSDAETKQQERLVDRAILGAVECVLLLCAAIVSLGSAPAVFLGLPAMGVLFLSAAVVVGIVLITRRKR